MRSRAAKMNSDGFAIALRAVHDIVQPLLQEMKLHAEVPGLELLLNALAEARRVVDLVTPMGGVERLVRSGTISAELAELRQGLSDALLELQMSSDTSARVKQLLSRLDSWQQVAQQHSEAEAHIISQQQRSTHDRDRHLESMMSALIERLGTGLPQLVQEIDSTLQQPGLSDDQSQVGPGGPKRLRQTMMPAGNASEEDNASC
jgi:hypothetical protein